MTMMLYEHDDDITYIGELDSSSGEFNDDGPGGGDEFMAVKPWYKHCLLELPFCHYVVFYSNFAIYHFYSLSSL